MGKLLMSESCPSRGGVHEETTEQTEEKEAEAAGAESTWLG
jgi:hypothetical protein